MIKKIGLILFFCITGMLSAEDLRVQFIGNAAFLITDGKTTLLTDYPYRSGAFGYMTYDVNKVKPQGDVLCLITHGHADHFEPPIFLKKNWRIIAPDDVIQKIAPGRSVGSGPQRTFNNIRIEALTTPHAKIGHYSYLVTWQGNRLYFTGDTDSIDALMKTKQIDVAFVTPWLLESVQKSGKEIDAASIVIYHHTETEQTPSCNNCRVIPQNEDFLLKAKSGK